MNRMAMLQYRSQQANNDPIGIVELDPNRFKEAYPQFNMLNDTQLQMLFVKACSLLNNTKCSYVKDLAEREMLLFLLMAHMAMIQSQINEGNSAVGRASSASEGSVSVSLDYGPTTNAEKWYTQTPYGAEYWQMTSKYRSFLYTLGVMPMPVWRGGYYV
ncbi:DUF4054 domain-containing protein [Providencia manganoxydans]|uniref:DUF4054 domain-containing protein n=1 Tax=Providencia manganoxydans TaxID=2923283 RepID=UPI0029C0C9D6|nr:DUF4054 domain-containing protein [Providencia manganoxydans]MDX4947161.1 DUF4054 domain-containing protein [Providencia manganoxydans]